jgi:hypothetical protein
MMSKMLVSILVLIFAGYANADYFQDNSGNLHYLEHSDVMKGWVSHLPSGASPISDATASSMIASQAASAVAAAALLPNRSGFIAAMNTALGGIIAANNYAKAYPLFMPTFDASDWINASAIIQNALSTAVITSGQYAAIKSASLTYNIPLTLP